MNTPRIWVAGFLFALLLIGFVATRFSVWVLAFYGFMSLAAITLYWRDKRASIRGTWRVRELSLHNVDLLGGIIGGLMAQEMFRHKTNKPDFAAVTWFIAALHAGVLIAGVTGLLPLARLGGLIYALRG